jgi:hypothetical protein
MEQRRAARGHKASPPPAERAPSSQNSGRVNPFADPNPFVDPERSSSDSSSIRFVTVPTTTVSTLAKARVARHPRDLIASFIFPITNSKLNSLTFSSCLPPLMNPLNFRKRLSTRSNHRPQIIHATPRNNCQVYEMATRTTIIPGYGVVSSANTGRTIVPKNHQLSSCLLAQLIRKNTAMSI